MNRYARSEEPKTVKRERERENMKTELAEFAPLDVERAEELRDIINKAAQEKEAVTIDPDEEGITGSSSPDLLSPTENTNGLVRYRRHY